MDACKFCGSNRDLKHCGWLVENCYTGKIPAGQIVIGEAIQLIENIGIRRNRWRRYWAKVLAKVYPVGMLAVMFGLEAEHDDHCLLYWADPDRSLTVSSPGLCYAYICEFHRRELGPEVYHCLDHWNAWEDVR